MSKVKVRIKRPPTRLVLLLVVGVALTALVATSCNVTRTITNKSQFYQSGDTTVTIVTKTTESYDGSKK